MALRPVYSVQLIAVAPALANNFITVPDGSVIVLRDIDAHEVGGTTGGQLAVDGPAGNTLFVFTRTSGTVPQNFQWVGRQVFNAGESFNFRVVSGTWDVQASGYLLATP